MRKAQMACLCMLLMLGAGCTPSRRPNVVGKLQAGTFWKNPMGSGTNEGGGFQEGSRVELYDGFVVITTPNGDSHVFPQGHYSGLVIRQ
jgi:hypothetical protein